MRYKQKLRDIIGFMTESKYIVQYTISFTIRGLIIGMSGASLLGSSGLIRDYPITQISKVECRILKRNSMPQDCKIDLPRFQSTNYTTYQNNKIFTDAYSVLRGGSYSQGRNTYAGSHPGIDIPTAEGTPVYAAAQGEVFFAGWTNGYGYNVIIKHTNQGETLYSIYAHLSEIMVTKGQRIARGQRIGSVGNSGTSMGALGGYHLHFEIARDNNNRPLYAFLGCPENNLGDLAIIEQGKCQEYMRQATLDPIYTIINSSQHSSAPLKNTEPVTTITQQLNTTITPSNQTITLDNIDIHIPDQIKLKVGQPTSITLTFFNKKTGQPYNGILPSPISLISASNAITTSPKTIQLVTNGSITITIESNKILTSQFLIINNHKTIASFPIIIQ